MNILQIQDALGNLSDDQLKAQMMRPSAEAPQYLVLSEMQRRKAMREDAAKGQAPPPSSMKDEAMQGLGSLPQAPPQAPPQGMPPQGMAPPPQAPVQAPAQAGPAGYASGGVVDGNTVVRNGVVYQLDALTPQQRQAVLATPDGLDPDEARVVQNQGAVSQGIRSLLTPAPVVAGPTPGLAYRQREMEIAAQRPGASPAQTYPADTVDPNAPTPTPAPADPVPEAQRPLLGPPAPPPAAPPNPLAGLVPAGGETGRAPGPGLPSVGDIPPRTVDGTMPPSGGSAGSGGGRTGGIAAVSPAGRRSYADFAREAQGAMPDRLSGFDDEAARLYGGAAGDKLKQNANYAIIEAGLRMAGSRSPRLAEAVAEGGLAGLQSYRQGLEEAKKAEREGFSARLGIAQARGQQDTQVAKIAGDLSQNESREFVGRENNATQLRAASMSAGAAMAAAQLQAATSRENAQLAAATQRYATDNPASLAAINGVLRMPAGPEREAAWKKITSDPQAEYYAAQTMQAQRNGASSAINIIMDNYAVKPGEFLSDADKIARMARRDAEIMAIKRQYPTLYPEAQAGAAAPAAAADPLGLRGGR